LGTQQSVLGFRQKFLNVGKSVRTNFVRQSEHRFLSELIRQRKADPLYKGDSEFKLNTDKLEQLINEGYY
jgi:hypothetical protein